MLERSYVELILLVALARTIELVVAGTRDDAAAQSTIAREPYRALFILVQVVALGGPLLERAAFHPPWHPLVALTMLGVLVAATVLRVWVLIALGLRARRRVPTAFDADVAQPDGLGPNGTVARGPYRYLRHPAYVATMLEIVSIPLIGSAWFSCAAAVTLYAFTTQRRIALEQRIASALSGLPSTLRQAQAHAQGSTGPLRVIRGGRDEGNGSPPVTPQPA